MTFSHATGTYDYIVGTCGNIERIINIQIDNILNKIII